MYIQSVPASLMDVRNSPPGTTLKIADLEDPIGRTLIRHSSSSSSEIVPYGKMVYRYNYGSLKSPIPQMTIVGRSMRLTKSLDSQGKIALPALLPIVGITRTID